MRNMVSCGRRTEPGVATNCSRNRARRDFRQVRCLLAGKQGKRSRHEQAERSDSGGRV